VVLARAAYSHSASEGGQYLSVLSFALSLFTNSLALFHETSHLGRVSAGWGGCGRSGGDCHTGQGHKLLGVNGGGGCGVYGEREEVVANR